MEFTNRVMKRKLGSLGLEVSALGLGTMMMPDNEDSIRTIHGALDQGITLFDTADIYGEGFMPQGLFGGNEQLVGRALKGRRDQAILATKFGIVSPTMKVLGHPAYVKNQLIPACFNWAQITLTCTISIALIRMSPLKKQSALWLNSYRKVKSASLVFRKQPRIISGGHMPFIPSRR